RAIGETMAVIMVAGNQARIPDSLLKGVRTLTANIVIEMGYATDLHREALIATGVVLFVFILVINLSFNLVKNSRFKLKKKTNKLHTAQLPKMATAEKSLLKTARYRR
ncbi:MAG: hypothetical protein PT936_01210, partial [Treponema sp.]|nr:hypothetical protein [Treponema sp.]